MAHLKKLPTYFVKGDERRAAYYTIQAKEFRAAGFVEEGEKAQVRKPIEKQPEMTSSVCSSDSVRMSTLTMFLRKSCGARSASVRIMSTSAVPKSPTQLARERLAIR